MTTLFLSYARDDDEPFVKRLYEDLTAGGFDVWWDRVSMPGRALTFLQEIRDAIAARDRLVLVVGPAAVASDYVGAEWRCALEIGKAINPVLRLGDYDLLPEELKLLDTPDFRDDANYAGRLGALVRQLSEPVAPMGRLVGVPSLPPHFLRQPERLRALKDAVLADLVRPVVVTGTAAKTGIHGMGGIGKSVLAAALARDHEVRRAFPDGVIWVPVGQQPALVSLQRDVAKALGDPGQFETEHEGKERLRELLADRAAVLVLDDVWQREHAEAFDVLGPRCRAVLTSRDASLTTTLGGTPYQVQLLTDQQALALLADWAECPTDQIPGTARDVMAECGRLPLALSMCGAMVRDGVPWEDVREALAGADLEFLGHDLADYPHKDVMRAIKVSVDALAEDQRRRFVELAVFPPDETVPEAAVLTLWSHTGPMKEYQARKLLTTLERRALVRLDTEAATPGEAAKRRVSLHDLLYDYACRVAPERAALHGQVLAAYRKKCPGAWSTGPDDGYFLQQLRRHLAEAGQAEELVGLLENLDWLEAKGAAGLVFDLPLDFAEARRVIPADHPQHRILGLLEEALRRDIHFIARHAEDYPQALFQCLWNTCWWYDCPEAAAHYEAPEAGWPPGEPPWEQPGPKLCDLLERWRTRKEQASPGFCWMRSIRPPVWGLGTALVAVIRGGKNSIRAAAISPDARWVVSSSTDRSLSLWSVESSALVRRFETRASSLTCLAFLPDGDRVFVGFKGRAEVWDCMRGSLLSDLTLDSRDGRVLSLSPDGRRFAGVCRRTVVKVWETSTGDLVQELAGHTDPVLGIAISSDGRRLVTSAGEKWGKDNTVRLWDIDTGAEILRIQGGRDAAVSVALSGDDRFIAAGVEQTVRVWDTTTGSEAAVLCGHTSSVPSVEFSPDARRIVSGSFDLTVRIWDATEFRELALLCGHDDFVTKVAFSSDGRHVMSRSGGVYRADNSVRIWDAQKDSRNRLIRGNQGLVRWVGWSPDGTRVVSAGTDKTIRIWDGGTGRELHRLPTDYALQKVGYSRDGAHILAEYSYGTAFQFGLRWNAQTLQQLWTTENWGLMREFYSGAATTEWEAKADVLETVVRAKGHGGFVAAFPVPLECLRSHPSDAVWAGARGRHTYIVALERTRST